jgi:hypothetical protein
MASQSQMFQSGAAELVENHFAVHPMESISVLLLYLDLQSPNVADGNCLFHHRSCRWNNVLVQFEML